MNKKSVIIIGAGWAGLSAAVRLAQNNFHVTLLESAKQPGGRAREVSQNGTSFDNGQHIMVGAYHETLKIIQETGVDINTTLLRLPLMLNVQHADGSKIKLCAPAFLPAPFHLLAAFITAKGLSIQDRYRAVYFGLYLLKHRYHFKNDISVSELLDKAKQTDRLINNIWEPLCLAIMNTAINKASANIFARVFKDAFTNKKQDSNLLLPKTDLSALFPEPAKHFLYSNNCELHTSARVEQIQPHANFFEVCTQTKSYKADHVIIATAPQHCQKLISPIEKLATVNQQLSHYEYEPITTVYLKYPETISLPSIMTGITGTVGQWVFDRGQLCRQPGWLAVVISASGKHQSMENEVLAQTIHNELYQQFQNLPEYDKYFVIRDKKATFAASTNVNSLRPGNTTPIQGLFLAGDYTDTPYPATLEGAVQSGLQCAHEIINQT